MNPALLMLLTAACSEYDLGKGQDDVGPGAPDDGTPDTDLGDTGSGSRADTAEVPSGDTAPGDTAPGDTAPPGDPGDACWEPEDGYAQNPAARIFSTDSTTPVVVTFVASDTAYQDALWIDAPESSLLVRAWADPVGSTLTLGPYRSDIEIVFGVQVANTGQHWRSGPSSRNSDGVTHVAVTYEGGCSWLIGFEDLTGGGDLDFNDVVMRVQGMLRQEE